MTTQYHRSVYVTATFRHINSHVMTERYRDRFTALRGTAMSCKFVYIDILLQNKYQNA